MIPHGSSVTVTKHFLIFFPEVYVWVDRLWSVLPKEPQSSCQSFLCLHDPETDPVTNGAPLLVFQHPPRHGSQWKVRRTVSHTSIEVLACCLGWADVPSPPGFLWIWKPDWENVCWYLRLETLCFSTVQSFTACMCHTWPTWCTKRLLLPSCCEFLLATCCCTTAAFCSIYSATSFSFVFFF